ncbi:uncharacterized protein LOC6032659 [Culex quinquefasciatus]|uniref:uncharacterized protein LOC6032659 n=1 Tax=Culex quinquefasciatus TaxID=7176 RepID=UPI0018E33BC1|nr:uncharacterized protein LOC6032659 [Culex quinquefasciatus]
MKYEAISLLALLVHPIGSLAVDIFDGIEDGVSEPAEDSFDVTVKDEPENVPKKCVKDIIPDDSISFKSKALQKLQNLPNEVPQAPPLPKLGQFWTQITTIFQQPTFGEKVEEAKQVFNHYRALIKAFSDEWLEFFTKNRQDAIENVQKVIQDTNQEIKSFFTRKFSEFDGLCLPEDNECLQSVQNSLKEYSKKVEENTAACGEFVDRQLDQHDQLVADEQKKLESGMLRIDGCFQKKEFLGEVMACVGSVAANFFHQTSQATQKFATVMGKASASVRNRLGRFRTCVVERKRLLAGGQNQIAEKATACLKAQKSSSSGAGLFQ